MANRCGSIFASCVADGCAKAYRCRVLSHTYGMDVRRHRCKSVEPYGMDVRRHIVVKCCAIHGIGAKAFLFNICCFEAGAPT